MTIKRLSLDVDEVLRAQIPEIIRQARLLHGADLTLADFSCWDAKLGYKCRSGLTNAEFDDWAWGNPQVALAAQPLPNAVAAVQYLARYYDIVITTASGAPEETEYWLRKHGFPFSKCFFTGTKHLVDFDLHVDDSLSQIKKCMDAQRPIIKMAAPNNGGENGIVTMQSWADLALIHDNLDKVI